MVLFGSTIRVANSIKFIIFPIELKLIRQNKIIVYDAIKWDNTTRRQCGTVWKMWKKTIIENPLGEKQ